MPEYLAPGVYVEEIDTGSKPIEGVSTSTAGMVGATERGPVGVPVLVTSNGEFQRLFGGLLNTDFGAHRYLPHAVEGFFTNGGKRLYVVRVLDEDAATRAAFDVHFVGPGAPHETLLLRAVGEGEGDAAVPLLVLDAGALAAGDTVRVGDGSLAEYRQIGAVGLPADATHVPLHLPVGRTHAAGALVLDLDVVSAGTVRLAADAEAGDDEVVLEASGGGAIPGGTLANLVVNRLLRIGTADNGEYRFIASVDASDPASVEVELDAPLATLHPDQQAVELLDSDPITAGLGADAFPDAAAVTLQAAAAEGDTQVQVTSTSVNNLNDLAAGDLLRIGNAFTGEYGVVASLGAVAGNQRPVTFDAPLRAGHAAAAAVARIDTTDRFTRLAVSARSGAAVAFVDDRGGDFDDPTHLILFVEGTADEARRIGDLHLMSLAHPLADALPGASTAEPVALADGATSTMLSADARAGSVAVTVDARQGLAEDDVLRVGAGAAAEYLTVDDLPNRAVAGPDPGVVVFTHALSADHTAGEAVVLQTVTAGAGPTMATVFDAGAGASDLVVTDGTGYAAGDLLRITTPAGRAYIAAVADADDQTVVPLELSVALFNAHPAASAVAEREALFTVEALDAGGWGNRLRVSVEDEPTGLVARTLLRRVVDATHIRLASAAGVEPGTVLELLDPATGDPVGDPVKVALIDRTDYSITLDGAGLSAAQQVVGLAVRSREFRLTVYLLRQPDPAQPSRNDAVLDSEIFRYLSMDSRHSRYVEAVVGDIDGELRVWDRRPEGASQYVRVRDLAPDTATEQSIRLGPETLTDVLPNGRRRAARHPLAGGADSVATLTDALYVGTDADDPEDRTGLHSLHNIDQVSIVAVPGRVGSTIQDALIAHCENDRYRFAVLDGPVPPADTLADVQTQRQQFDTKYAALYYPWLLIPDPFPATPEVARDLAVPPSGHVVGIYARTDIERGVHKAPANEVVRGIRGLSRVLNKGQHDILNPYPVNINVIRDFRASSRGIRVWGARVITSDPDYKYVPVRRLLIFLEESIDEGLQWVVFEPNAEPLWARVRRTISDFLRVVWRNGALEGTTEEEAFFVRCDRTTMTQTDIDNGRLICLVGVAPVKPAEYVIIRIGLKTAEAES